jgi:hypothetical protein
MASAREIVSIFNAKKIDNTLDDKIGNNAKSRVKVNLTRLDTTAAPSLSDRSNNSRTVYIIETTWDNKNVSNKNDWKFIEDNDSTPSLE